MGGFTLQPMNIGKAAQAAGVSPRMVRHYEDIGLIALPSRTPAGYRVYGEGEVHELRFVRRARDLGFTVREISRLLGLWRNRRRSSADVKRLVASHVEDLEKRIAELEAMRQVLKDLARHCHGDARPECPILEDLAGAPRKAKRQ
jgi:MerR family copper efflux transcriptional regulator